MTVNSPLLLNDSKGRPVDVQVGAFDTKVSISKNKLKLEVKDAAGKMRKIEMKHGLKTDKIDEVTIPGSQSGQQYDLTARRVKNVDRQITNEYEESCSECVESREVCGYEGGGTSCSNVTECNPNDPSQCKTRQVCDTEQPVYRCHTECSRYFYGNQTVTKYITTKTTDVIVVLQNAAVGQAAQFVARKVDTDKSTSYGSCR